MAPGTKAHRQWEGRCGVTVSEVGDLRRKAKEVKKDIRSCEEEEDEL